VRDVLFATDPVICLRQSLYNNPELLNAIEMKKVDNVLTVIIQM
jgi:hypothetical protein